MGKCTLLLKSLPRNDMNLSINMLHKSKAVGGTEDSILYGVRAARPHEHSAFLHWATINWSQARLLRSKGKGTCQMILLLLLLLSHFSRVRLYATT